MKNLLLFTVLIISLYSCNKNDPGPGGGEATGYMSLSAGSTRNYEQINNNPPTAPAPYTTTSTTRDTTIGARTYHIFSNSATGGSEYYNQSGNDYYSFQKLPAALGGSSVENLYLKVNAEVNTSWSQAYNVTVSAIPVTVTIVNKIIEKGISKTVNAVAYNNVIHVKSDITASSIFGPVTGLTTDIHSYYAPKVGLIQNTTVVDLNFMGFISNTNTQTNIKTATIL
ncbi:MAG: hypothetical protein WKF35_00960 [Ferruginibacter sp.]